MNARRPLAATLWRIVAAAVIVTYAGHASADELKPFRVTYDWIWNGLTVAVTHLTLEQKDDTWVYSSKSEPRGLGHIRSERPTSESIVKVTDSGVRPLSYKADDGTSSTKRDINVQFDWEHNRVTGVYEDTKVDMELKPNTQDDHSMQIALMVELLKGRTPEQFPLLDNDSLRDYHFVREGEETLTTPLGSIATTVFRSWKTGSPRVLRFWCAPSRGFIPMRVEQKKGDDVQWSMQIVNLTRN
jgi:hypothetical protein